MLTLEIILFITCSIIIWLILIRTLISYMPEFSFLKKADSWEDVYAQWVFLAPACVIISALLLTGDKIAYGSDWLAYFQYHQVVYDSVKGGELLHWSTAISGGYPWAGHPDQPGTTILMLPILVFGVVFGLKLNIAIIYALCLLGTFLLARKYLHLSILASCTISSMVISSTLVAVRVYSQKYTNIFEFLTPLCIFLFLESLHTTSNHKGLWKNQRFWVLVGTSILIAVMLYQGKLSAIVALLILFCISTYESLSKKNMRAFLTFAVMFIFAILLAAPKIIPMYELLLIDPRYIPDWEMLRPHIYTPRKLINALISYKYDEIAWITSNQIIGLGIIPLLLAIYGMLAYLRKTVLWVFVCAFFVLIVLGDNSPLPIGYYMWHLPIMHSMADLDKYFSFYIMFSIAVLAGFGLEKIKTSSTHGGKIAFLTALVVLTLLTISSTSMHREAFKSTLPNYAKQKDFFFVELPRESSDCRFLSEDYLYYLQNIGTINSYTNIKYPNRAQARYKIGVDCKREPNPLYRGEAYTESGDGVVQIKGRSQNYIELDVQIRKSETVVVNQNYNKYWQTSVGEINNDGSGILKVYLEKPGEYILKVQNINKLFLMGCLLGLLAILLLPLLYITISKMINPNGKCNENSL